MVPSQEANGDLGIVFDFLQNNCMLSVIRIASMRRF